MYVIIAWYEVVQCLLSRMLLGEQHFPVENFEAVRDQSANILSYVADLLLQSS